MCHVQKACTAAAICVALAGCGLPPIINGARFLIVKDSGIDVTQIDFPDQRICMAAQRRAGDGAARCQRTTMWDALPVSADVDLPDRTRVDATSGRRPSAQCPDRCLASAPPSCCHASRQRHGVERLTLPISQKSGHSSALAVGRSESLGSRR